MHVASINASSWLSTSLPQLVQRVSERPGPSMHLVYKCPSVRLQRVEVRPEAWSTVQTNVSSTAADGLVMARPITLSKPRTPRTCGASESVPRSRHSQDTINQPSKPAPLSNVGCKADVDSVPPCLRILASNSPDAGPASDSNSTTSQIQDSYLHLLEEREGISYYGLVVQSREGQHDELVCGCYLLKTSKSRQESGLVGTTSYSLTKICPGQGDFMQQMQHTWLV